MVTFILHNFPEDAASRWGSRCLFIKSQGTGTAPPGRAQMCCSSPEIATKLVSCKEGKPSGCIPVKTTAGVSGALSSTSSVNQHF